MNKYTATRLVIGLILVGLAMYAFIVGSNVIVVLGLLSMIYGIILILTVTSQRERINKIMNKQIATDNSSI